MRLLRVTLAALTLFLLFAGSSGKAKIAPPEHAVTFSCGV